MLAAYLGGIFIYQFLLSSIEKEYDTVKVLKSGDRGTVTLLRHRATHAQFIFRQFTGSADVYQKLLGLSCPHLPQILEAASEGEQVAVLEEYIQGDSLDYLLRVLSSPSGRPVRSGGSCARACGSSTAWEPSTGM